MNTEIILSPEELYFFGKLLQAKYMDYAYVAAIKGIGKEGALFDKEIQAKLVSSGALLEDFSGNIEVNSDYSDLLKPVFFGEFEAALNDYVNGDEAKATVIKFHMLDDVITMVSSLNGKFIFKRVDLLEIKEIIENMLPENYSCEDGVEEKLYKDKLARVIVFKNTAVGKAAKGERFFGQDGKLLRISNNVFVTVSRETFENLSYNIIKG